MRSFLGTIFGQPIKMSSSVGQGRRRGGRRKTKAQVIFFWAGFVIGRGGCLLVADHKTQTIWEVLLLAPVFF